MNKKIAIVSAVFIAMLSQLAFCAPNKTNVDKEKQLKTSIKLKDIGTLDLQKDPNNPSEPAQLVLHKKVGNITIVADTYEGLEPYELLQCDFNHDKILEFVAVLRYPESPNVVPYVYSFTDSLEKIFPKPDAETELLNCREVFISQCDSKTALCLKYLVSYHDYAPPELFKLEMYTSDRDGQLQLTKIGYNEGTHFNLLMNMAAEYMHNGRTQEAAALYNQALTSSTGEITQAAFTEGLFSEAEALKFSGKYSQAMKLYEKLVLEYTDSNFTELAQKELEFLYANQKNPQLLNQYFKIQAEIVNDQAKIALNHLNEMIQNNPNCEFIDRLLFSKAELLISENKIDEAITVYKSIKVNYPNSSLIETIDEMLEDLEAKPEDTDGL